MYFLNYSFFSIPACFKVMTLSNYYLVNHESYRLLLAATADPEIPNIFGIDFFLTFLDQFTIYVALIFFKASLVHPCMKPIKAVIPRIIIVPKVHFLEL